MAGIIQTALVSNKAPREMAQTGVMANQPGLIPNSMSTGYEPEKLEIDPATQTVEGRVSNLIKTDSPFITEARTRAAQGMNQRGLINSSMALGEGEKAAYSAALPIATADVQNSLTVAGRNQDAANQSRQLGAQSENTVRLQELTGEQALEQQELRGAQSKELAQIEAQYKQVMQTNDSAARLMSQISASVGEILKEPNMGKEQKDQLMQKQIDLLKNGLAVIGGISNLDLKGLLVFDSDGTPSATPGTPDLSAPVTPPAPSSSVVRGAGNWRIEGGGDSGDVYLNTKTNERISPTEYRLRAMEGKL